MAQFEPTNYTFKTITIGKPVIPENNIQRKNVLSLAIVGIETVRILKIQPYQSSFSHEEPV
jgi:hypothetical protein